MAIAYLEASGDTSSAADTANLRAAYALAAVGGQHSNF
jgi:hypothetical protein